MIGFPSLDVAMGNSNQAVKAYNEDATAAIIYDSSGVCIGAEMRRARPKEQKNSRSDLAAR